MGNALKVLMDVSSKLKESFTGQEIALLGTEKGAEKRRKTLEEIYDEACQEVISRGDADGKQFYGIDYFDDETMDFSDAQESTGYGFGAVKPDEIRSEILNWNRTQSMSLIRLLKESEAQAEQRGFGKLSELLESMMEEDGQIRTEQFKYPVSAEKLKQALNNASNTFAYGQDMVFYAPYEGICFTPYAPVGIISRAKEHP